jgi:hypothetical protein
MTLMEVWTKLMTYNYLSLMLDVHMVYIPDK